MSVKLLSTNLVPLVVPSMHGILFYLLTYCTASFFFEYSVSDLHTSVSTTLLLSFLPAAAAADTCMQVRQFVCDVLENAVSFSVSCSSLSVCVSACAPDQTFHNFRSHKKVLTKEIVVLFSTVVKAAAATAWLRAAASAPDRPFHYFPGLKTFLNF